MKIQRLGWAGIKITSGSTTLFIDAISNAKFGDRQLTAETNAVHALITHHHTDHFDPAALKTVMNDESILYCHEDTASWIDSRLFRTQTVRLHQPVDISRWTGDLVATAVPAVDGFGHPQVSWVIQAGGKKVIHCGDTLWHVYWRDITNAYGPFDFAFLPINAARINRGEVKDTGIPAVMSPEQAVVAAKLLKATVTCPIHYGRATESYFETPEPEENFIRIAKEKQVNYVLLKAEETVQL